MIFFPLLQASANGLQIKLMSVMAMFYFGWNGSFDKAEMMESEQDKFIKFHWDSAPTSEYFEFRIEKSEITNQTILIIKDFAEKKEIKDQSLLWDHQVKELFHRLGN
jgi:hypothetical protein